MLMHGHAAHGLFVLPMFTVAVVMWGWEARELPWKVPEDQARVAAAVTILLVFLFPLAIDLLAGSESNLVAIWQQFHVPSEKRHT